MGSTTPKSSPVSLRLGFLSYKMRLMHHHTPPRYYVSEIDAIDLEGCLTSQRKVKGEAGHVSVLRVLTPNILTVQKRTEASSELRRQGPGVKQACRGFRVLRHQWLVSPPFCLRWPLLRSWQMSVLFLGGCLLASVFAFRQEVMENPNRI